MESADCPDKLCLTRAGLLSAKPIVCLPNRVMIVVDGGSADEVDAFQGKSMEKNKLRKTLVLSLLTAAALVIYIAEAQIPALVAIPGVKLGLSNVMVLAALYLYGRKEAAAVLIMKITLGSVFSGQLTSFLYSAAGGLLCLPAMSLLKPLISERQLWAMSAFAPSPSTSVSLLRQFL
jgi:hypothetical protein